MIPTWALVIIGILVLAGVGYGIYYFVTKDLPTDTTKPPAVVGGGGGGGSDTDAPPDDEPPSNIIVDENLPYVEITPGLVVSRRISIPSPNKEYTLKFDEEATDVVFVARSSDQVLWKTHRLNSTCVGERMFTLSEDGKLSLKCSDSVVWQAKPLSNSVKPYKLRVYDEGKIQLLDGNDKVQWDPLKKFNEYPAGTIVRKGDTSVTSPDGRYVFKISNNGVDAEFTDLSNGQVLWITNVQEGTKCGDDVYFAFQDDGNVVLYCNGQAKYATDTHGKGSQPYRLRLSNEPIARWVDAHDNEIWNTRMDTFIRQSNDRYSIYMMKDNKKYYMKEFPYSTVDHWDKLVYLMVNNVNVKPIVFRRSGWWWLLKTADEERYVSYNSKPYDKMFVFDSDPKRYIYLRPYNLSNGSVVFKDSHSDRYVGYGEKVVPLSHFYLAIKQ